jgi:hypothetical protein
MPGNICISRRMTMFEKFPKTRPQLPKGTEDIYSSYYKSNREGRTQASSLAQRMESWMHKEVGKDLINLHGFKKATLEIGAGTLNQLQYEPNVDPYDIVEPFKDLYKGSPFLERLRNIYSDISEVPDNFQYDRITSVATFEHICNLPEVVARCGLFLADNGVLRIAVPSEDTILWTLGWKLTTGLEFKIKYGLDYGLIIKHEHVNTAKEIEEVLKFFFEDIKCKVLGLSKSISFYQFYVCRNPRITRCREYSGQPKL